MLDFLDQNQRFDTRLVTVKHIAASMLILTCNQHSKTSFQNAQKGAFTITDSPKSDFKGKR